MARKPRVLIATRLFPPEVGAAAFRLQALADGLVRSGALVRVLTTCPPVLVAGGADHLHLSVRRFPVLRDAGGNVRGYLQYLSFDIPLFFRLLFSRADIVVSEPPPTTGLMVAITSWLHRRPYVYYAADIWTDALIALSASPLLVSVMRALEGYVLRHAACVIAVSHEVAEKTQAFGAPGDRVVVAGNGVNTDTFSLHGPTEMSPHPYLVYTGTMSEWQGAEIFIEAMPSVLRRHPGARLHFFGQGSAEQQLKETAARLKLDEVSFGGVIAPPDAARWLRGAAAGLASIKPNLGYDFAKPTKVYAAAACGAPTIFAGRGAGVTLVAKNALGRGVDYETEAVAAAMCAAIEEQLDGTTQRLRSRRADWVAENASLSSTGTRAAAATLAALDPAGA